VPTPRRQATVGRLCEAVAQAIAAMLTEIEWPEPYQVGAIRLPDVAEAKSITSLRVDVYPLRYGEESDGADRIADAKRYAIGIDVWDRYRGGEKDVPLLWQEEREWLTEQIAERLGDPQLSDEGEPVLAGEFEDCWPDSNEVAFVYDPDRLRDRLFSTSIEIVFRRDEE
jgi:hypothetical protein